MNLVIESLLLANIWIFFYNTLLFLLRLSVSPPSIAEFVVVWPKPEPSEIPLYLVLTFVMVIVVYLFHRFRKDQRNSLQSTSYKVWRYVFLAFMLVVFINNLGGYPLKGLIQPDIKGEFNLFDYFYLLIYLFSFIFILIEANIITNLFKSKKKLLVILGSIFLLILIAVFTFEPRFPISPHDYSFFFGPIYEVANGKTLYSEATSQYGFLSIIFLAFLFKLKLLSFASLPIFVWFLYIMLYFFCFFLIYKVSRSITLALIGLFSIITLNYYSLYHLPISIPQVGAMRWLPVMLAAVLFYRFRRIDSLKFIFLTGLLSFWVVDSGLAIILAYFATLFIFFLAKNISFKNSIKAGLIFVLNLMMIFGLINLFHIFFGLKTIDFANIFLRLRQYTQAGFGMLPMESQSYFWFIILIYFASVIYYFKNNFQNGWQSGKGSRQRAEFFQISSGSSTDGNESTGRIHFESTLLIFIANLSFTSAAYYIGRSHPHNLFHISIFPILNLFVLISLKFRNKSSNILLLTSIVLFSVLIAIPAFNRKEVLVKIIKTKTEKIIQGSVFKSDFNSILQKKFSQEIKLINDNLTDPEVALLSIDDTFLLDLTGKKNLLYNNPQIAATTYQDLNFTLQKTVQVCPKKIAIDCRAVNKCSNFPPLNESSIFMPPLLLKVMQDKCQVHYEPTICTEQLCIAVSQRNK